MKMISNDLRSSCRSLLLGAYQENGGTKEVETEWTYPADWPALPDAGTGEAILLIRPWEGHSKLCLNMGTSQYSDLPEGYAVTIDWGDGEILTKTEFSSSEEVEHEYSEEFFGQYIFVRFCSPDMEKVYESASYRCYSGLNGFGKKTSGYISSILAACVGKKSFSYECDGSFAPIYVKFLADDFNETSMNMTWSTSSANAYGYCGEYRYTLSVYTSGNTRRIDFVNKPVYIGGERPNSGYHLCTITGLEKLTTLSSSFIYMLQNSYALWRVSLPELTEVPENYFRYCYSLEEVYLPKCTKIGANAFSSNQFLRKVTVAADCEIDSTAFANNSQFVDIIREAST